MINQDFLRLFDPPEGPGVGFRQGVIVTWDAETGENTVNVEGEILTNVSILNTGEAIALKAGHTVGLLTSNGSWFIIGRITPSGDPNFASASVAFANTHNSATNFSVTTVHLDKVTSSLTVPSWVDEALVTMTAQISLANTSAGGFYPAFEPFINGVGGGGIGFGLAANASASFNDLNSGSVSWQRLITAPGPTISLAVQAWVNAGTLPATATSTVILDATAIYRSTV